MGSKLPMIGIVALGAIAAVGAALLTAAVGIKPAPAAAAEPSAAAVVVAARDLEPMTRLTEADLEVREVPPADAPAERFGDPVGLLGRLVRTPLVKGQPVLAQTLLEEGAGARLALSLPDGARAVSIEFKGPSALRGLIYPGSRVDVLASERGNYSTGSDAKLLLQNVRVLAVGEKTVFDKEDETTDEDEDARPAPARQGDRMLVTVMVKPEEARLIQAARERGELSLSLRNPLDASIEDRPVAQTPNTTPDGTQKQRETPEPSRWTTLIVRGSDSKTVVFDRDGRPVQQPENQSGRPPPGTQSAPPPPPPTSSGEGAGEGTGETVSDPPSRDDSAPLAHSTGTHERNLA